MNAAVVVSDGECIAPLESVDHRPSSTPPPSPQESEREPENESEHEEEPQQGQEQQHAFPAPAVPLVPSDPPWDVLFPRKSKYRDAIVSFVLPHLLLLLREPTNRLKSQRDLVNQAMDICQRNGNIFWGKYEVYTRRRSAVDAILVSYFSVLQDYVAGRPIVPL